MFGSLYYSLNLIVLLNFKKDTKIHFLGFLAFPSDSIKGFPKGFFFVYCSYMRLLYCLVFT